jgi:hypothetical protein
MQNPCSFRCSLLLRQQVLVAVIERVQQLEVTCPMSLVADQSLYCVSHCTVSVMVLCQSSYCVPILDL